jgi:putative SOS response-associated peptidase YedK
MCGRFTLTRKSMEELATALDVEARPGDAALYRPRYNIAPTDQHWILRTMQERRELLPAAWGLVNSWQGDAKSAFKQINARSETAPARPAFRDAYERRRCVVPADGFFEWTGTKQARRPIWFHPPDGGLILFAGLQESWRNPATDAWQRTFTILTTSANELVAPVHDRMPVILPPERIDEWLHIPATEADRKRYAESLGPLLAPADERALVATEVSPRVNAVANDDPACLTPALDREPAESPRLL